MKKNYALILIALLCFVLSGFSQTSDLFISEYSEGSSNNKYVEIYNGTGNPVDLSDYEIWRATNGEVWPDGVTISLSGVLIDGDTYVIANSLSNVTITSAANLTTGNASWNGDDAVGLAKDITGTFTLIDAIGVGGVDPGTAWNVAGTNNATVNHTLVRKSTVCDPTTNWTASAGTNTTDSEWIVYNQDDWTYIGAHTDSCASCTVTVDFNNLQSPATGNITIGGAFNVFAQVLESGVTDSAGQGANIESWIGYSSSDTDPSGSGWTWVLANYNIDVGNNDEYILDLGAEVSTPGTYYYASRFRLNNCNFTYGGFNSGGGDGFWDGTNDVNGVLIVNPHILDWCNLQSPASGNITTGAAFEVYAQVYEPGVTDTPGAQGANIEAWIGYNTISIDHQPWDPTGWTWIATTYDSDIGNNDQYVAEIGSALSIGTYYYASRFQLNGSEFSYGGIDFDNVGNFWDATNNSGVLTVTNAPCSDLIISEYIEGSGNNKYIEIFNGTGAPVTLTGNYTIQIFNNGSAAPSSTTPLTGTIANGATRVYQDSSALLYGGTTDNLVGGFNGNDAIALVNNATIIDVIGEIGFNPGTAWTGGSSSTQNRTLRRKSTVQVGDADGSNVFAPNVEWDTYPIDSIDDLGFHFSSCYADREIQLHINSTNVACGFTYSFGNQLIDSNTDVILTIDNLGGLPLEITGLNFATGTQYGLVGAPGLPFTIPATSSQNLTIRFNPDALGVFSDTLTVISNDVSEGSCDLNLTGISSSNCSTTTTIFAAQDFESAPSDTWVYTANHTPISGNWDVTSSLPSIASAQSGSNFWGITDLERSGHTNQTHELSFSQSLVGFTNVQLEFHYYTINIDATDSFEYELIFDGVSQGINDISADTGTWTEVLVNIPDTVNAFDIVFYVDIDATNDNAGLDNFSLTSTVINTVTWDGTNWDWDDGVTMQDTPPGSSSAVILNAPFNTLAGGLQQSFSACSLTINNVLLTIDDGDFVEVDNSLIVNGVNGGVNIEPQGSFVQINDSGTVSATVTTNLAVSKLTAPSNNWYEYTYWSSPVFEETVANGLAFSNPNRRFQYNAQYYRDSTFENINDDSVNNGAGIDDIDDLAPYDWDAIATPFLQPGVGYASTHNPLTFAGTPGCPGVTCRIRYTFSGLFNNGVITVPLYRNDTETGDNNWNFVGNPYPSAISADTFLAANMGLIDETIPEPNPIIEGAIYLWSQNTAPSDTSNGNENENFSQSDYAIINGTGQTAAQSNGGDATIPSRHIPSGQGFFISMANSAPSTQELPSPVTGEDIQTADLTFNNSMRVTGNNNQFFRNATQTNLNNKLWVNLFTDNGVFSQILIGYLNNATDDYDGMFYDAPRNSSTGVNSIIYTLIPDVVKKFAIQGKNTNSLSLQESIPLGFYTSITEATLYTFSIEQLEGDFMTENAVYVIDRLYETIHELSASDYTFTSETGEFNNRFEIVFRADALSIDDQTLNSNDLTITELLDGTVEFRIGRNFTITNVEILDVIGRQIYNLKGHSSTERYDLSRLSKAAYIAKVTLSNGQIINKKAIKQH